MDESYLSVNQRAYDALAQDYRRRAAADRLKDVAIVEPFVTYLRTQFGTTGVRVLDIGPGNGVNLAMFREAGLIPVGVDISPEMLKVAAAMCPEADLILGDFLSVPFAANSFHGVFAKASLHLLPKHDALRAFDRVHELLVTGGLFYITTTVAERATEGYYVKRDYPNAVVRFRKFWTRQELLRALQVAEFTIWQESYNHEAGWEKHWLNVWAIKKNSKGSVGRRQL